MRKVMLLPLLVIFGCLFTFFSYCVIADEIGKKDNPSKHCQCIDYNCGCCTQLEVKHVLDGKLCANFSYLPDQYGVSATITYKDIAIFNDTVSAKNPPPICFIHFDKIQTEICLKLYDLNIQNKCFSGCAEFEVSFFELFPLKKLKLGCFGEDCKKSTSFFSEVENIFHYLTGKTKEQTEPQPQIVLI